MAALPLMIGHNDRMRQIFRISVEDQVSRISMNIQSIFSLSVFTRPRIFPVEVSVQRFRSSGTRLDHTSKVLIRVLA